VSAGRQRRFVWLGVFGAASRAAVLLSIDLLIASGEWSSPVDQDHPGDLWPGCWAWVFFGVTPAAGPGVVLAVISRAADHCVTEPRQQDETFGSLNPEHLVGMLGWRNPPGIQFSTSNSLKKTGCRRADFGDRTDLLADQGLRQRGRECDLLLRAVRCVRAIDADNRHRPSLTVMYVLDHRAVWSSSVARPASVYG
jgi:hypothetical protein